jgi:ABC-type dipeptide/oligopeptide/nickel transport system permease component
MEACVFRVPSTTTIACLVAVAAFLVAVLAGAFADNSFSEIVGRALFALVIAWPIGWLVGMIVVHQFSMVASEEGRTGVMSTETGFLNGVEEENPLDPGPVESDVLLPDEEGIRNERGVVSGPS